MTVGFDVEKVKLHMQHLERMMEAHTMTDDESMAVALLMLAVNRFVRTQGPGAMGAYVGFFVDVWRFTESVLVKTMILKMAEDSAIEELFAAMKDGPTH